jgi:hypothetical protein
MVALKNHFKPGDAIRYADNDGWVIDAIVSGEIEHNSWMLRDWFYVATASAARNQRGTWRNNDERKGSLPDELCRPHPDPDTFFASYAAWRLVNG